MFSKEDILKKLNSENYFIDLATLDTFIKEWHIDAIFENNEHIEFFDDTAILKIKKGISLKSQGYNKEQISYRINRSVKELDTEKTLQEKDSMLQVPEVKNKLSLNWTNEALEMLSNAVSSKIVDEIKTHINSSGISQSLIEAGTYKKDNEILTQKVDELMSDNKKLAKRIEQLENDRKSFWQKLFG